MSNFRKVGEFHKACGLQVQNEYGAQWPLWETRKLRIDLIKEELEELIEANESNDLVGIADALTDLLYVVYGAGHCYNMDLDACFDEVHRNNMTKVGPDGKVVRREDGKILKPEGYQPVDLSKVVL